MKGVEWLNRFIVESEERHVVRRSLRFIDLTIQRFNERDAARGDTRPSGVQPWVHCLAALLLLAAGCATGSGGQGASVERVAYHGWAKALRLSNAVAEVVVVPEIGRVMSFRLGDGENVFWEDRSLDGQRGDWSKEWINFGGDKTWPAPQDEWDKYTRRSGMHPPPAFDSLPVEARIDGSAVVLTSAVDPYYGIRVIRRVHLERTAPVMRITTTYERVTGSPAKVAVWVITQFKEPDLVCVPVAAKSVFTNGYFIFPGEPWPQLQRHDDLIEITRDPKVWHKMGSDGDRLLWMGRHTMCLVESPRVGGGKYPDSGSSAEVFTSPDPARYIEIETLGPLTEMKAGDKATCESKYTLMQRMSHDARGDARGALGR